MENSSIASGSPINQVIDNVVESNTPLSAAVEAQSKPSESPTPAEGKDSLSTKTLESSPNKEEKPKEAKTEDKIASKFAALARKERLTLQKQSELKAEEARLAVEKTKATQELQAERAKLDLDRKTIEDFNAMKGKDPFKALEMLGWTYEQLSEALLNDKKPTPEQVIERTKSEIQKELEALRSQQAKDKEESAQRLKSEAEDKLKKEQEALQAEQTAAQKANAEILDKFLNDIDSYVETNSDLCELIKANNVNRLIFDTIERRLEDTKGKELLSIAQAAALVEKYLEQQVEKNLATKKFSVKVSPPKPDQKVDQQATSKANATPVSNKTITNDMGTASSAQRPPSSDEERWNRALAAMNAKTV